MQRSLSHQKPLVPFVYIVLFILYSSLSTMYLFLPPLLSVLYILFSKALQREDTLAIFLISLCLIVFEVNFGYMLLSTIVYFYLLHKFIMPKIAQNFSCKGCILFFAVVMSYLGYFLFLVLIGNIFMIATPHISYYIIYYIILEFFFVSLL